MTREEFRTIFNDQFANVRNYIYYRAGDESLATDVAQEAFMKLWEKRSLQAGTNVKALLYKIAGDVLVDHFRKQKVALKYKGKLSTDGLSESPDDLLQYKELLVTYEKALGNMPEKQRAVFLMSRMDGLKHQEIADLLGIGLKAVEKRMNIALDFLRRATIDR